VIFLLTYIVTFYFKRYVIHANGWFPSTYPFKYVFFARPNRFIRSSKAALMKYPNFFWLEQSNHCMHKAAVVKYYEVFSLPWMRINELKEKGMR